MAKSITRIEAKKPDVMKPKRVAAYCRVSTDSERLLHSLSAQVSHYSSLIQRTPGWVYAGVYADEATTGTKVSSRDEFQRMMADCEAGKIDIILTKSLSRFARNTVDTLASVRRLRELGIEVRFEKEKITSLDEGGELMITLYAAFAQEEIRSLSDNVKWGTRRRFEQGSPNGHFRIFGYRWDGDQLVIHPEEAAIVRRIFQNFLDGKSRLETEREFAAEGITTANGCRWVDSNIKVVLTNVTYTGNMLFQKEYIEDPITKKRRQNHGELAQYYVENTHEAIIDKETFDYVQAEIARRKELGPLANKHLNISCFSSIIRCTCHNCSFMRSTRANRAKTVPAGEENVRIWTCGMKRKKGGRCSTKNIPEKVLYRICAEALGLESFDEDIFVNRIEQILVLEKNHVRFIFKDGNSWETHWVSSAKRDWWTPERKAAAGQFRSSPVNNPYRTRPFSRQILCGICGQNYRSSTKKLQSGDVVCTWTCPHQSDECTRRCIHDERLREVTATLLGMPTFDSTVYEERVHHITVLSGTLIEFSMLDGTTTTREIDTRRRSHVCSDAQREKMSRIMKSIWEERYGEESNNDSADADPVHSSTDC